ncbi:22165_t:CDS:2, partial [Entrophospora sp. SA101]
MLTGDTVLGVSGGIIGLIIFIIDIIIVFEVLNSNRTFSGKFVWVLLIFLFPV